MYTLNPFRLPLTKENSLAKIKLLLSEFISKGGLISNRLFIRSKSIRSDKSEKYLFELILLDKFNNTFYYVCFYKYILT